MCKTPHKHAELIKAWADGATIQFYDVGSERWGDCNDAPLWLEYYQYRIKPEPSDLEKYGVEVGDVWFVFAGYIFTVSCANVGSNSYRTTTGGLCEKSSLKTLLFRRGVVNKL